MTQQSETADSIAGQLRHARHVASFFSLPEPLEVYDFPEKGNINQSTFLVFAGPEKAQHLLQLLNPRVFTQPRAVMNGMIACISSQQQAISAGMLGDQEWETIQLIPTREGKEFLETSGEGAGECWRMMTRIRHAQTYRSLRQIPDPHMRMRIAEEAGRGLALFGNLTAGMDVSAIEVPLPGYRDTELYYSQLNAALAECRSPQQAEEYLPADPKVRNSTERHFLVQINHEEYRARHEDPQLRRLIDLALAEQSFGLTLAMKLKSGELKRVIVHGDTKLDNFLFSTRTGKAKALVDLDTIMPHTWLSDWGDMVRSLVNISGEREADLNKIDVDTGIFKALARGFLGFTRSAEASEIELMVEAAQVMALELAVRFLADYLRGDSYFRLAPGEPQDLNKIRAMVQFRLFQRMRGYADAARKTIRSYSTKQ